MAAELHNSVDLLCGTTAVDLQLTVKKNSQLMERDVPELPGIVIVMSGATCAMQRARNLR